MYNMSNPSLAKQRSIVYFYKHFIHFLRKQNTECKKSVFEFIRPSPENTIKEEQKNTHKINRRNQ